jgi:hypothetical protein
MGRVNVNNKAMGIMILSSACILICFNIQFFAISAFFINFGFRGFNDSSMIYL